MTALIFDMDGTMVDSMPAHRQSWVAFCRLHGLNLAIDDVMARTTGRNGIECMRVLFDAADMDEDECLRRLHQKEQTYRDLFAPVFAEVAGFARFRDQAHQLGYPMAIGTAGDKANVDFVLQHLNLAIAPHAIVRGDEGLPGKPDPAIFLEAARRMGVDPQDCTVFEDAPFGIEAARRAGMRAVAICTTHTPAQLAGPHVVASVRDYTELLSSSFLEKLHVDA